MKPFERKSPRWLALSIAVHVMLAVAFTQVVFRYSLGQLMGIPKPQVSQERLQYIALQQPTESSSGASPTATPATRAAPTALQPPAAVPTTIAPPPPPDSSRSQAAGGTGTGLGVSGSGLATGLVPRLPDARIALSTGPVARTPRTVAEDVDSVIHLAIGIVKDSMAIAAGRRQPGDWSIKGKDGQVWGWDQDGIRLGKFSIPNALLALLPLNVSSPVGPIEARSLAYIRRDIIENAQRSITEDDFRASVKRIRERKEREKRQKLLASGARDSTSQPE